MFKPVSLRNKFIKLAWNILYHKALYYELAGNEEFDHLRISDSKFDKMEDEYKRIAKLLHERTTASDSIGFSLQRPSHLTALSKVLLDHHIHSRHNKEQ